MQGEKNKITRQPSRNKSPEREFVVETEILLWLNRQPGVFAFKIETGGYYDSKKGFYRKRKSEFNVKGTPDIIGLRLLNLRLFGKEITIPFGLFFGIEVKRKSGGVISVHQKAFLQQIRKFGGRAGVARNIQEAANIIGISI